MGGVVTIIILLCIASSLGRTSSFMPKQRKLHRYSFYNKKAVSNTQYTAKKKNKLNSFDDRHKFKTKVNPWGKSNFIYFRNRVNDTLGKTDYPLHGRLSEESRDDEKNWF